MAGAAAGGEGPFRLLAALLLGVAVAVSGYHRWRADRAGGELKKEGRGALLIVLRALGVVALLPVLAYLADPRWVGWARLSVPPWLRWLAGAGGLALLAVLVWTLRTIGLNISPSHTTREGHRLVTHGPYRFVRHPLYTTGTLLILALALLSALWWPLAWLIPVLLLLLWRTPREEMRLVDAFGDEYRDYMRRTGRYLPRLRAR